MKKTSKSAGKIKVIVKYGSIFDVVKIGGIRVSKFEAVEISKKLLENKKQSKELEIIK